MDFMNTPPHGVVTPPFNSADHLIILTPDAPTATADSAPPWIAVTRALRGIHPLAVCARMRAAALGEHFL
jgi:hypothetical protein